MSVICSVAKIVHRRMHGHGSWSFFMMVRARSARHRTPTGAPSESSGVRPRARPAFDDDDQRRHEHAHAIGVDADVRFASIFSGPYGAGSGFVPRRLEDTVDLNFTSFAAATGAATAVQARWVREDFRRLVDGPLPPTFEIVFVEEFVCAPRARRARAGQQLGGEVHRHRRPRAAADAMIGHGSAKSSCSRCWR